MNTITLEMIEKAGVVCPRSIEVAPLLFSEARGGGVKTSVPCEDGELAWYSIRAWGIRHEFKKEKSLWRTAFPKRGGTVPRPGEMWLCKYAGENPGKTIWIVDPVQKMWRSESRWAGIVAKKKDGEIASWITDNPRQMWWTEDISVHSDGEVRWFDGPAFLPTEITRSIVEWFRTDLSGWRPRAYADSSVCAVSLEGKVLIGEKDDTSFYKHYGLKNDTVIGLYQKVLAAVKDQPALRLKKGESIQGKGDRKPGNMYVVRQDNGHYLVEIEGKDAFERIKNFEQLLKDFGVEYEVLSDVEVCHEFMAMMLKAQFDPFNENEG